MAEFTDSILKGVWLICTLFAIFGAAYLMFAAILTRKFVDGSPPGLRSMPGVSLVKPLCGAEPGLQAQLESFCVQDYAGPVQILFGLSDPADPAVGIVRRLIAAYPDRDIALIIDPREHGANRKISNIINMMTKSRHSLIVLSDSDIRVAPTYLRHVVGALETEGIGLVTCLYRGRPGAGLWSRLSAMSIDHHFLPNALIGLRLGLAQPCFGATMALRAETLSRIGGFEAFSDQLADDYAIGAAVRQLGLEV